MEAEHIIAVLLAVFGLAGGAVLNEFGSRYPRYRDLFFYGACGVWVLSGVGILLLEFPQVFRWWPQGMVLAGALLFTFGVYFWTEQKRADATTSHTATDEAPAKIKSVVGGRYASGQNISLRDLIFSFEFPGDGAVGSKLVDIDSKLVKSAYAEFITMQDLKKRVSYNVAILPENAVQENAALKILTGIDKLRASQTTEVNRKPGDFTPIVGERLPYSDKFYLYHEGDLSDQQKQRIWDAYKEKGLLVDFRGPNYIKDLWERRGPRKHASENPLVYYATNRMEEGRREVDITYSPSKPDSRRTFVKYDVANFTIRDAANISSVTDTGDNTFAFTFLNPINPERLRAHAIGATPLTFKIVDASRNYAEVEVEGADPVSLSIMFDDD